MRAQFRTLLNSEAWGELSRLLEEQIKSRRYESDKLATGFDHLIAKEVVRGEIAGLMLAVKYPEWLMNEYDEQIKLVEERLDDLGAE